MLLLAADTSAKQGSIALARAGEKSADSVEIIELVPLEGGTFSAQLVPQIAALLNRHGLGKHDIGAFVVASGPGSFTGLRVGLAAIKGLAEALSKPIASVSILKALALGSGLQGRVRSALDAGRGELYLGEYAVAQDSATVVSEKLLGREEIPGWLPCLPIATPDRALAEFLAASGLAASVCAPVDAAALARVGWNQIRAGLTVTPEQLEANYIRRTDAEIFAKPRG